MKVVVALLVLVNLGYAAVMLVFVTSEPVKQVADSVEDLAGVIDLQMIRLRVDPQINDDLLAAHKPFVRCAAIGPWSQRAQADRALLQLRASGMQGVVRDLGVNSAEHWQVLVQPLSTRAEAIRVLKSLYSMGVAGHVTALGADQYVILVGDEKLEQEADAILLRLQANGVAAKKQAIEEWRVEYWLSLSSTNNEMLSVFLAGNAEVEHLSVVCPSSE